MTEQATGNSSDKAARAVAALKGPRARRIGKWLAGLLVAFGLFGFLAGPPLIGIVADVTTLQGALFITVAAALIIAACARMVKAADTY